MDKQMIEEMAKDLYGHICGKTKCEECNYNGDNVILSKYCPDYLRAKQLVEKGYRKIPVGAVLLTREEHKKYLAFKIIEPQVRGCLDRERKLEKQVRELDKELNLAKSVLSHDDEMPLAKWEQTIRKETAEKFAERLKPKLCEFLDDNEDYDGKIDKAICFIEVIGVIANDGEIISLGIIDEICKEITEGNDDESKDNKT